MTSARETASRVLYGVGMAAYLDCDAELPLAAGHPSAQAGFQLEVEIDHDVVTAVDLRPGLMHRSAEKLFEARDYRQLMMLANRHDWLSAFSSELGVALAVEAATGITPPVRATWIRMLLAELNRVAATLAFIAAVAPDPGIGAHLLADRERLVALQGQITGGRVHPMYVRLGGVAFDVSAELVTQCSRVAGELGRAAELAGVVAEQLRERTAGLAVLTRDAAVGMGASGAVARASGLDLDLRRDDPYLSYPELTTLLDVPVRQAGDAAARYEVLAAQIPVSLGLVAATAARLAELDGGPVDVLLPKVVRVPEGMTHAWTEGPLGISGYLLVSAGDRTPWRMKIRSASYSNAQAMQVALVGTPIDRLADAVMSFFFLAADIDR